MSYQQLIENLFSDTAMSVKFFLPELTLCGTILLMLLARLFRWGRALGSFVFATAGAIVALYYAAPWLLLESGNVVQRTELFTGMLVYDSFTIFFRGLLLFFLVLFCVLSQLTGIPDKEDSADYYTLVLGAVLGMMLMVSANHLLIIFLAVEMASVPSYVLAGMLKGRRKASEAALKYSIYGAGTAGVMLYGISLVAGITGTAHLPTVAVRLSELLSGPAMGSAAIVLALGALMIAVGLAFKLSAVPFHFWCPDVFEGASAEVNAFLSVASKAAALALLVRVAIGVGYVPEATQQQLAQAEAVVEELAVPAAAPNDAAAAPANVIEPAAATAVTEPTAITAETSLPQPAAGDLTAGLAGSRSFVGLLIALIAAVTCTFGNLAAFGQTNIKRLLAYSTIAHAGYMMMPVSAALVLLADDPSAATKAISTLVLYLTIYLFMNLGAFAIVAFLRNQMFSEEIADYAGLIRTSPGVVVCFTAILFSLVGIPPLAGFLGKFAIFEALVEANLMWLLVVAGINTAISLYYYLRVAKVMIMDEEPETRGPVHFPMLSLSGAYVALVTAPVLLLIFNWNGLNEWARAACSQLLQ